jgi:hypothetical protein
LDAPWPELPARIRDSQILLLVHQEDAMSIPLYLLRVSRDGQVVVVGDCQYESV